MSKNLKENLLEMFFPSHCVLCNRLGPLVCDDCKREIIFIKSQTCPMCNKISKKGKPCSTCRNKLYLSGVVSCMYFKEERVKDILHPYKYEGVFSLSSILSDFLEEKIKAEGITFNVVTYVPASKKHENKRGYNQSKILAEEISKRFGKPIFTGLLKNKNTKSQVGLPRKERLKNMTDSFYLSNRKEQIVGKKVLIIDDVITTGATLNECAKVLRAGGCREVWALTVAKE